MAGGCSWQGTCILGACMLVVVGGCGKGHVWWGACMAGRHACRRDGYWNAFLVLFSKSEVVAGLLLIE